LTAPRFFADDVSADRISLTGDEARHAVKVLRLRPGEEITISDGAGTVAYAVVEEAATKLTAQVERRVTEPRPRPELVVFQAIPTHGKLDLVVQKLTEVGVGAIHLFAAERSVARWDSGKGEAHAARLGEIAYQASKQSRRAWLARVVAPVRVSDIAPPAETFALHEEASLESHRIAARARAELAGLPLSRESDLTKAREVRS